MVHQDRRQFGVLSLVITLPQGSQCCLGEKLFFEAACCWLVTTPHVTVTSSPVVITVLTVNNCQKIIKIWLFCLNMSNSFPDLLTWETGNSCLHPITEESKYSVPFVNSSVHPAERRNQVFFSKQVIFPHSSVAYPSRRRSILTNTGRVAFKNASVFE